MSDGLAAALAVVGAVVTFAGSLWAVRRERMAAALDAGAETSQIRPAGFWIRFAARMADQLVVNIWFAIVFTIVAAADAVGMRGSWIWLVGFVSIPAVYIAYFAAFTARNGQTWGKKLAGVVVEGSTGSPVGWARSIFRAVADLLVAGLDYIVVGYIDPIFLAATPSKRSLRDFIAGTRVRRVERLPSVALPWIATLSWLVPFVVVFVLIRPYVMQLFWVAAPSMQPTLVAGDHVVANKLAYRFQPVRRGDVVVFAVPDEAMGYPSGSQWIKRVVALPGDEVRVVAGGGLIVNGKLTKESHVLVTHDYSFPAKEDGRAVDEPHRVGSGMCFVLGDDRNNSNDSHIWGDLSLDSVQAKVAVRYWPPERAGLIR